MEKLTFTLQILYTTTTFHRILFPPSLGQRAYLCPFVTAINTFALNTLYELVWLKHTDVSRILMWHQTMLPILCVAATAQTCRFGLDNNKCIRSQLFSLEILLFSLFKSRVIPPSLGWSGLPWKRALTTCFCGSSRTFQSDFSSTSQNSPTSNHPLLPPVVSCACLPFQITWW